MDTERGKQHESGIQTAGIGGGNDAPSSPERREAIRRLAKASTVLPVAAVIFKASTTICSAS